LKVHTPIELHEKTVPALYDLSHSYGLWRRETAGTKEGFAYSKAMKASGVVWDEATMDAYLTKPAQFMPGNKMTFIGLKKQEDRDAVQAYMKDKTTP